MRLTEKNEFGYVLHIKPVDNSIGKEIAMVGNTAKKLGQLEDIEDELGIDLVTLFKAIKQGYIYRKIYRTDECIDFDIVKEEFDLLNFEECHGSDAVLHCGCLSKTEEQGNYKQCYQYLNYINSYGKTWALTKEVLENGF